MRALFIEEKFHDYAQQGRGERCKAVRTAYVHEASGTRPVSVSLYRPKTKDGDPRFWIYGFRRHAAHDDVVAIFILNGALHAINLTKTNVAEAVPGSELDIFLANLRMASYSVANELLKMLRDIASKGPILAACAGSTSVGRSVESALGIKANSSRDPDYKGIELKSGRSQLSARETRATLFACVPDWEMSQLKSSAEILHHFGYYRGTTFKLYCTVTTKGPNPQGLQLTVDEAARLLKEVSNKPDAPKVAIWKLSKLEQRLSEKHRETFWIKVKTEKVCGQEMFHLHSITHTRSPNIPQLERMLVDGTVTLDHLIKRVSPTRANEKGPLFKIVRAKIPELFLGKPRTYALS
ncbi:MvaI/BcnI restriction endonuclease family protein [Terrimicrobium sacchariphilum]|uniref:MvaI/BcnI restriction endonuclease family protein n=2 Tax=Terrimicrobium sacchariphilum TaxID=690879 RepID=A0A146GB93_TERSA|nr:MvaI/BcnI restriction endonuclease family protein [Terrimicrobium sacchariphilum]